MTYKFNHSPLVSSLVLHAIALLSLVSIALPKGENIDQAILKQQTVTVQVITKTVTSPKVIKQAKLAPQPEVKKQKPVVKQVQKQELPAIVTSDNGIPLPELAEKPEQKEEQEEIVAEKQEVIAKEAQELFAETKNFTLKGVVNDYETKLLTWLNRYKRYPRSAKNRRLEGEALLKFYLDRKGGVSSYKVVKSSGHKALDLAALQTIERAAPYVPRIPSDFPSHKRTFEVPIAFAIQ